MATLRDAEARPPKVGVSGRRYKFRCETCRKDYYTYFEWVIDHADSRGDASRWIGDLYAWCDNGPLGYVRLHPVRPRDHKIERLTND